MAARTNTTTQLGGDYPTSWSAFVGQETAKAQLMTAARSAKKRRVRMEHTLLSSGRPGIGKTSLALLCAQEMRATMHVATGSLGLGDARLIFANLDDGDVLFIDEIHQLVQGGKAKAEWLLHYLQDGVLVGPLGPEEQPAVTIIGATTDAGRLPETILDRFPVRPMLSGYTLEEAAKIAQGMAKRIFTDLPVPSAANCREVALAASFNPRVIRSILSTVRDIALVHNARNLTGRDYDLTEALRWLGLTPDGLNDTMRRYLVVLLSDFNGEGAGQTALQDRLQEPGGLGYTERLLMDKGLIAKSKAGRVLTQEGIRRAKELLASVDLAA